jgi:hypothetical protein
LFPGSSAHFCADRSKHQQRHFILHLPEAFGVKELDFKELGFKELGVLGWAFSEWRSR